MCVLLQPCIYLVGLLVFTAQVEVIAEGQGSAVHVLHTGRGEDSRVLPDTEWLETRSRHRQLLPESRPLLQRIHENLSGPQEAGAALQQIQRQVFQSKLILISAQFCLHLALLCSLFPAVFADPQDENKIGIDGIQQFCDDLTLDPASMSILVVAWKLRAATQCEFSRKEFLDGMSELGWATLTLKSTIFDATAFIHSIPVCVCSSPQLIITRFCFYLNVSSSCDSPEKLKAILPRLEQELKDIGKFKDFYQFTFNFAKNPGQKGLGKHKDKTWRTCRTSKACHFRFDRIFILF